MGLRYRCILIDHDDTAVDSTAAIHYPAHLDALAQLRPGRKPPTREQWLLLNFHGIMDYLEGELRMTPAELERELEIWRSWTHAHVPPFFPGFLDLLKDYHRAGGRVAVISHSEAGVIEGHYRAAAGGLGAAAGGLGAAAGAPDAADPPFLPDLIFGWVADANHRKPSPWPVGEALRLFGLPAREALVVDDLKPGVLMARAAGVDFAAAGWSHRVEEIERYMREQAVAYCAGIQDLRALLLGQ
jgi:beta-phosphoglucomutase-like phosphatase (HAD superfamily)